MPHLLKLTFKLAVCGSRVRPGSLQSDTSNLSPISQDPRCQEYMFGLLAWNPEATHGTQIFHHFRCSIFGLSPLSPLRSDMGSCSCCFRKANVPGRTTWWCGWWPLSPVDPCCLMLVDDGSRFKMIEGPPYAPAPSYQDAACKTYGQHSPLAVALIRCRIWAELERGGFCECGAAIDGRNLLCWCLLRWIDTQSWRSCAISFSISFLSLGGNLEVSINGDTPNGWFIIDNPKQKWMIWGYRVSPWLRKPSLRIARSPAGRYLHAHFPLDLEVQVQVRQESTKGWVHIPLGCVHNIW